MDLILALVVQADQHGCLIRRLDAPETTRAAYALPVQKRVKIWPAQLVAVDLSGGQPAVVWRWFRGRIDYMAEGFAVVNNRLYQPECRIPISVARIPAELEAPVHVGDEVFYSLDVGGVIIDTVRDGAPAHPERLRADMLPAIIDAYAEMTDKEAN